MSHEVESMLYAGKTPWHGLGTYVGDQEVNSEEAIVAAGLNWEVVKRPLYRDAINYVLEEDRYEEVDGWFEVARETDNALLGVVQGRYTVVQNSYKFRFIDNILGSGVASIHTAGSLKGGKIVWILAKLQGIARVKNTDDTIERYLLLSSAHDGSMPVMAQFTPVRVVCANTLNAAFHDCTNIVKVRHTANADAQFKIAENTMKQALDFYEVFEQKINWLADQKFTDLQLDLAINRVMNDNKEEQSTRIKNYSETIKILAEHGKGNAQWRGTAWGAYNAFTEFSDWERSVRHDKDNVENRVFSNWFGNSVALKQKALDAIVEML